MEKLELKYSLKDWPLFESSDNFWPITYPLDLGEWVTHEEMRSTWNPADILHIHPEAEVYLSM